jgi:hypothetical protein
MAVLELFAWFIYTLTTMIAVVITIIYTILHDIPWIIAAAIIALNITTGAAAYCFGQQACEIAALKHISEASIRIREKSRPITLNIVVRVAEPVQRVPNPSPKLVELANVFKVEGTHNGSKENPAQLQPIITLSPTEHLGHKEQAYNSSVEPPVLTNAEKKEKKLKALKSEKELLEDNAGEEAWQQSELLRLYIEATDDWTQARPGEDTKALEKLHDAAKYNWSMGCRRVERKKQRLKHIDLDINALSK